MTIDTSGPYLASLPSLTGNSIQSFLPSAASSLEGLVGSLGPLISLLEGLEFLMVAP
jgi:hypothetical protein